MGWETYRVFRRDAAVHGCGLCHESPKESDGESMLIFMPFDKHDRQVSAMDAGAQLEAIKNGVWLCPWCYKGQGMIDRTLSAIWGPCEEYGVWCKQQAKWQWIREEVLKREKCAMCGMKITPENVDFFEHDHVDVKIDGRCVFSLVHALADDDEIRDDMARCRVLCPTCHRQHTHKQNTGEAPLPTLFTEDGEVKERKRKPSKRKKIRDGRIASIEELS